MQKMISYIAKLKYSRIQVFWFWRGLALDYSIQVNKYVIGVKTNGKLANIS